MVVVNIPLQLILVYAKGSLTHEDRDKIVVILQLSFLNLFYFKWKPLDFD